MSDRVRWVPLPAKVHAFQVEIGGNQRLLPRRKSEHGAVVADAQSPGRFFFPASPRIRPISCFPASGTAPPCTFSASIYVKRGQPLKNPDECGSRFRQAGAVNYFVYITLVVLVPELLTPV